MGYKEDKAQYDTIQKVERVSNLFCEDEWLEVFMYNAVTGKKWIRTIFNCQHDYEYHYNIYLLQEL